MRRLLFLLLIACSSPTDPTTDRGDVGRFELLSIGGRRPPVASAVGVTYWGGSIEFRADSTFVDVITMGDASRATVVDSVFGRYVVEGDSVRMDPAGWTPYVVRRRLDVVTVVWAEGEYRYRRSP